MSKGLNTYEMQSEYKPNKIYIVMNNTVNKPVNTKSSPITATELYAIDANPIFVWQSALNDDGSIIMKWETCKGIYYTKSQVF